MFESLNEAGVRSAGRRLLALFISGLIHGLTILVIVLLPLLFVRVLPGVDLLTLLIEDPVPPPAPPPPIPISSAAGDTIRSHPAKPIPVDYVPVDIPHGIAPPNEEPPIIDTMIVAGGADPGKLGGLAGKSIAILPELILAPPPPPPIPPRAPKHDPMPVVSRLQESKLIKKVLPEYPPLAKKMGVAGAVYLEVTVDEEGNVVEVKVLGGHPLLIDEAVKAVKLWKYSPTLLNGEPIPVISTVTVIFQLNKDSRELQLTS